VNGVRKLYENVKAYVAMAWAAVVYLRRGRT